MRLFRLLALVCASLAAQSLDPAEGLLNQGYEALRNGDVAGAIAYFEDARQLAPQRVLIYQELGYLYLRAGRREEAQEAFETALQLQADDPKTVLQLAYMYAAEGRTRRARALFTKVADEGLEAQAQAARTALENLDTAHDPVYAARAEGYEALAENRYDEAIAAFRETLSLDPQQPTIEKELAYALLKVGETEEAREAFRRVVELDPSDERAALELAFLEYETDERVGSLERFQQLASEAQDEAIRATAAETARAIEAELSESVGRWELAVRQDPANRSARLELADLYERDGEPARAAEQYLEAWLLPGPNPDEILLDLGRARRAADEIIPAHGAWLLASRSEETRVAEQARDLLPERYPWANEFRAALDLRPDDLGLRKDLAYLLLKVGLNGEALDEFLLINEQHPDDLQVASQLADFFISRDQFDRAVAILESTQRSADPAVSEQAAEELERLREEQADPLRDLGDKSLQKSYLLDAKRLFTAAYRLDPADYSVALKLGVVSNLLREDREAVRWFSIASQSNNDAIAQQALQSYNSLAPQFRTARTTVWMYPFFSSRFDTVFGYGQVTTEFRLGDLPIRPYLSMRMIGDVRQRSGGATPQLLSESAVVAGVGVRARLGRGITLWGEAGEAITYLGDRPESVPLAAPDYRGGLNWFRAKGPTLGSGEAGWFWESNLDAVYISRFDHDALAYWQFRRGYRLPNIGWFKAQVYANLNVTVDRSGQYWANYAEAGPGIRFRAPKIKPPLDFFVNWTRGVHLSNKGNVRRPNYFEVRAGFWYSFGK